jgi:hypothetical protein
MFVKYVVIEKIKVMKGKMKKMVTYSLMWFVATILSLIFLKFANDVGSYWINVSWAFGVWFGFVTVSYLEIIKDWKKS